jgi:tetratricopeptide (TPR) repeat protein
LNFVSGTAAVVIGINYDKFPRSLLRNIQERARLGALRYAEADARDIAVCLEEANYSLITLLGAKATRRAIIDAIARQRRLIESDERLVIYFAGHGDIDEDDIAYLLPVDADPNALAASAIPLEDLVTRHLGKIETAVTLLDCCHSGFAVGLRGDGAEREGQAFLRQARSVFSEGRGRIVLAACAGNQLARELGELKHGAFTYYALDHWHNNLKEVDVESLYSSIDKGLHDKGLPRPVRGGNQQGRIVLRAAIQQEEGIIAQDSVELEEIRPGVDKESVNSEISQQEIDLNSKIISHLLSQSNAAKTGGDIDRLIEIGSRILALNPKYEPILTSTIQSFVSRGQAHFGRGSFDNAVSDFTHAIDLDPNHAEWYFDRGLSYARKRDPELAIADFTSAIHLNNKEARYFLERGCSYKTTGQCKQALEDFEQAIRLDPLKAEYHYARAETYMEIEDIDAAYRDFKRAFALGHPRAESSLNVLRRLGETKG